MFSTEDEVRDPRQVWTRRTWFADSGLGPTLYLFFGRSLRRDIRVTHFRSVWFGRFPIFGVFRLAHGLVKSQSGQVQGLVQSLFGVTQSLQFVQSGPEPWVCSSGLEFSKSVCFGSESSHEFVRSDPELSLSARSGAESTKSVRFGPEISKSVRSGPGLAKYDWSGPYGLLDLDLLSATHDCLTLSPIGRIGDYIAVHDTANISCYDMNKI